LAFLLVSTTFLPLCPFVLRQNQYHIPGEPEVYTLTLKYPQYKEETAQDAIQAMDLFEVSP
jgi:hypothetical protein